MNTNNTKGGFWPFFLKILKRTAFCLLAVIVSKAIVQKLHFFESLNPLSNQITDLELSDLCFAYGYESVPPDTNVYIVDCSKDDKLAIAKKIRQLETYQPKAIGLDLQFSKYEDAKDDTLIDVLNQYKSNIIFAYPEKGNDILQNPFYRRMFNKNNGNGSYHWGYLEEEELSRTKRYFSPTLEKRGNVFSVKVLEVAKEEEVLNKLFEKKRKKVLINYRKGFSGEPRYKIVTDIPGAGFSSNKIFLFGEYDSSSSSDKHFTPLNGQLGRSFPDMHGVEYHAQIISMILNKDYLKEVKPFFKNAFIFASCFLFMFLYNWLIQKHRLYHFVVDISFVLITVPLSLLVCRWLLDDLHIKAEPTDYLVPIFLCGLFLHLYEPVEKFLEKMIKRITPKKKTA